jgi:hypothetical protein
VATALRQRIRATTLEQVWLGACITAFLTLCWLLRSFVTDDAWITARYAENLADGHGFVWNPGGPRVEGFSNPLLVYAEAIAHVAGISPIAAARAIGVVCGVALLVAIHRLGPPVVGRRATRIALAVTALYPPMALWAVGGLETLPTALAATVGALLLARPEVSRKDALRAGLVLATLPWLRPEGIVIALAIAALAEAPGLLRRATRRGAAVRLAFAAGIPIASQVVLEAERLLVYGHLMPNSVIYKSGAGTGWQVLDKFADQATPLLVAAVVGVGLARGRQLLLAVPPAVYALGSMGTLDSVNSFSRFFMPTWPMCALLVGLAVTVASRGLGRWRPAIAMAAAVGIGVAIVTAKDGDIETTRTWGERYAACKDGARSDAAEWLRRNTITDTSFSISDAGLMPAQAGGRRAIDQFLLNDPAIQHTGPLPILRRVNLIFGRDPDVLVITSRTRETYTPLYYTDRRLKEDRRFDRYKLAHVASGGDDCSYHLFLYQKAAPRQEMWLASALRLGG